MNILDFYRAHLKKIGTPDPRGEVKALCPFHHERNPSFSFNIHTGLYHCFGCGEKGNALAFCKKMGIELPEDLRESIPNPRRNPTPDKKGKSTPISEKAVKSWHETLLRSKDLLEYLMGERGISRNVIERYKIGWNGTEITIPIRDGKGKIQNVRRYNPNPAPDQDKIRSISGHGENALFPLDQIGEERLVICEGELDCLKILSEGVHAITPTTGAGKWNPKWNPYFKGRVLTLAGDNDLPGLEHNHVIAGNLKGIAEELRFLDWRKSFLVDVEKADVSDFFARGGILDGLRKLITPIEELPPLPLPEPGKVAEEGVWELTPALDFANGTAYTTVPKIIFPEGKPVQIFEVIASKRERFHLTEENLLERGFYTSRHPHPLPRWSEASIKGFIEGKSAPSLETLFVQIRDQYQAYIDFLDERVYCLLSVWTIGSYFHRLFSAYPYIHLNGDPQTGKTKTLELTALIAFNGELTFHSTPAYIVRAISDSHCTCCVDEAERLRPSKDEDRQLVISMFNSGYKRGNMAGKVEATNRKGKWEARRFESYSPKMFASIKNLDAVLKTRCIPVVMVESSNLELKNRLVNSEDPVFQTIRDGLYLAMMTYQKEVKELYQGIIDKDIGGREWELWRPILTLALAIDDKPKEDGLYIELRQFALEVGKEKRKQREEETSTPKLLLTLQDLLGNEEEGFYPTSELAVALSKYDDEYFGWMVEDETSKTRGKVGRFLKHEIHRLAIGEYDKNIRVEGKLARGYRLNRKAIEDRLKGIGLS